MIEDILYKKQQLLKIQKCWRKGRCDLYIFENNFYVINWSIILLLLWFSLKHYSFSQTMYRHGKPILDWPRNWLLIKICNFYWIIMKHGQNDLQMSRYNYLNISLIGQKLWIFLIANLWASPEWASHICKLHILLTIAQVIQN